MSQIWPIKRTLPPNCCCAFAKTSRSQIVLFVTMPFWIMAAFCDLAKLKSQRFKGLARESSVWRRKHYCTISLRYILLLHHWIGSSGGALLEKMLASMLANPLTNALYSHRNNQSDSQDRWQANVSLEFNMVCIAHWDLHCSNIWDKGKSKLLNDLENLNLVL